MPNFSQEDLEMINSISSGNMRYPKPSPVAAPTAEPAAKTKDIAQASGSDDEVRRVKRVIKFPVKKRPAAPSAVVAAPAASAAIGNRKQAIQATENNKVKDSGDWQGKLTQATSSLDIRSAMTQASYSTSQPSVRSVMTQLLQQAMYHIFDFFSFFRTKALRAAGGHRRKRLAKRLWILITVYTFITTLLSSGTIEYFIVSYLMYIYLFM